MEVSGDLTLRIEVGESTAMKGKVRQGHGDKFQNLAAPTAK